MKHCANCKDRPSEHAEAWAVGAATPCTSCRVFKAAQEGHVAYDDSRHYKKPKPAATDFKVDPFFWDDLTPTQKAIVHVIVNNPGETKVKWAQKVGVTRQQLYNQLKNLRKIWKRHH